MYQLSTLNELSLLAVNHQGGGQLFTKAGAMIGYKGNCKFEKVLLGPEGSPVSAALRQIGRRLTGENLPLMKVMSNGPTQSYYANLSQHVTVIDLPPNMSLSVESENILAFNDACSYSFKLLAQGVISQKGLFTSTFKAKAQGAQVAILTDGNPLVIDTPCCIDPDAIIAWTGSDPGFKLDLSWKNLIGQASGESYMFEFKNAGGKVIVQPSERKSGINLAIDSGRPDVQQNSLFGNQGQAHNQGQPSVQGNGGFDIGDLGSVVGNLFGNRR